MGYGIGLWDDNVFRSSPNDFLNLEPLNYFLESGKLSRSLNLMFGPTVERNFLKIYVPICLPLYYGVRKIFFLVREREKIIWQAKT